MQGKGGPSSFIADEKVSWCSLWGNSKDIPNKTKFTLFGGEVMVINHTWPSHSEIFSDGLEGPYGISGMESGISVGSVQGKCAISCTISPDPPQSLKVTLVTCLALDLSIALSFRTVPSPHPTYLRSLSKPSPLHCPLYKLLLPVTHLYQKPCSSLQSQFKPHLKKISSFSSPALSLISPSSLIKDTTCLSLQPLPLTAGPSCLPEITLFST